MLKVEKLNVHFGSFHALKDVSLEIPDGEFFTLLGPSGCGKTTTLRAITGFIKPSSGKISINGRDITDIPVEKRNIGMVFQSYALFPTMTVYQNIEYYGMYIKYYLSLGGSVLKEIEKNDAVEVHNVGDKVLVSIRPQDIQSFTPSLASSSSTARWVCLPSSCRPCSPTWPTTGSRDMEPSSSS